MSSKRISPKKTMVKDIQQGIDMVARKYPKEISNYKKVAERVTEETNLKVDEDDITAYYESSVYQDSADYYTHLNSMGII